MKALGHQDCVIKTYSKVIADHIEKESEARKPELIQYLEAVRAIEKHYRGFTIIHIPCAQNDEDDRLAKATARKQQLPPDVFYEKISTPSTRQKKESRINAIFSEDWRASIMAYLRAHYEPSDEAEEKRLSQRARGYVISQGELYKSGVVTPWLTCIPVAQGVELLNEIHSGICESHIGVRPLAAKAFRQGFFWPSALKDAEKVVKTCEACQKLGPKSNKPSEPLQLIAPAWPLQW